MNSSVEFMIIRGIILYLGFLFAITVYQGTIAIVARKLGDRSFTTNQMATINPLPHIELFGTVILPLMAIILHAPFIIGWPKTFSLETRYFAKPKRDINIIYISAVAANFLVAFIVMVIFRAIGGGTYLLSPATDLSNPDLLIKFIIGSIGITNAILGGLYLLPIPNFSGWQLLINNVSYKLSQKLQEHALTISIVFLLLIILKIFNFYFIFIANLFFVGSNTFMVFG
jgi:Zn-dependent protease